MIIHYEALEKRGSAAKADPQVIRRYLQDYDSSWQAWERLARDQQNCPTLYKDIDREGSMHNSMEALRKIYAP